MFEAFDNCEHFAVVDVIVTFGGNALPGPEGDGVQDTVSVGLGYDTRHSESRRICMEHDREFRVEMTEDRSRREQGLEFIKSGLGFGGPDETLTFAQQAGDRDDNTRISFDETAVEVGESQEDLDVEDRLRNRPFGDGANAFGIHGDAFRGDDESEETDFLGVELAFLEFDV